MVGIEVVAKARTKGEMTTSGEYQKLLRELHERDDSFGAGKHVLTVAQLMRTLDITSLSDYGAGKKRLELVLRNEFGLKFDYFPYDPAFPEYGSAVPADLVCCIEVLEHVEPELIDKVLKELAEITLKWGFFTIHCGNAKKLLADGRNAHLLQQPIPWWLTKISSHFDVQWLNKTGVESFAVIVARPKVPGLQLPGLEVYSSDSIKRHIATCAAAVKLEIKRRARRSRWRPSR